jgi:hypothetical protein
LGVRNLALLPLFLSACAEPLSTLDLQGSTPTPSPALEIREEARTLPSPGVLYTTMAEVLKHPALFEGQKVRLRGKVVNVQSSTSPIESTSTTFDLVDSIGNTVKVVKQEHATVRETLEVIVEGRLTLLHPAASSPSSPFLVEVKDAHIVPISARRKASTRPAATLQPERSPPSLPAVPPKPLPTLTKDKGRIF